MALDCDPDEATIQPMSRLRKRTHGPLFGVGFSVIGGCETSDQLAPPSLVRTRVVQVDVPHGAVPRTHPVWADTKVTDRGLKPLGTGTGGVVAGGDDVGVVDDTGRLVAGVGLAAAVGAGAVEEVPAMETL
jgi:hypothetical protein